jgi:hypothetical protein
VRHKEKQLVETYPQLKITSRKLVVMHLTTSNSIGWNLVKTLSDVAIKYDECGMNLGLLRPHDRILYSEAEASQGEERERQRDSVTRNNLVVVPGSGVQLASTLILVIP